jgi:hypothetical protein
VAAMMGAAFMKFGRAPTTVRMVMVASRSLAAGG